MSEEIKPIEKITETQKFIENVRKYQEEGGFGNDENHYGHAVGNLAQSVLFDGEDGLSEEEQREHLREKALDIIFRYGKNIIPLLKDELKLSLKEEDWELYKDLL